MVTTTDGAKNKSLTSTIMIIEIHEYHNIVDTIEVGLMSFYFKKALKMYG